MTHPFDGKVALVTGAASGIGAAVARRLIDSGVAGLVLIDLDPDRLSDAAARFGAPPERILALAHDVADEDAWRATSETVAARFGRLDLAVANAGIADATPIEDTSLESWRTVMATNLDGVFLTLKHTLPLIRKGGVGGAVVVVASVAGIKAERGIGAYGASKAGALHLARIAAKEGAHDKIRVNAILPGGVETPIWKKLPLFQDLVAKAGSEHEAFTQMAVMATPLKRFATPDETAAQIAFLLSDDAATITGAGLVADGGYAL